MPRSSKTRRFTLLELMVVIALILILISLLFAGLKSARKKSKEVACLSNLSQFNRASMMFLTNNRTQFPGQINEPDDHSGRTWIGKKGTDLWTKNVTERPLNVYLGYTRDNTETKASKCPFNDNDVDAYNKVGSSYAGNAHSNWNGLKSKQLGQIRYPSTTALAMEIGCMAYIKPDPDKRWWRWTHVAGTPLYPFVRVDGSTIRHTLATPGEGTTTASATINFDVNRHP